jgi:hypothetical protein
MNFAAMHDKLYWTGSMWSEMSIYAKRFASREDLLRELGACPSGRYEIVELPPKCPLAKSEAVQKA